MPKIVQFGAGNIGRSLVGQLFARAGWEVVFADVVPEIISALNERGKYVVEVKDEHPESIPVERVRGVFSTDQEAVVAELVDADMISTAVGPMVLPRLFPVLAEGLRQRSHPITIIFCENLRNASQVVRAGLTDILGADFPFEQRVGLVETSIGKMVPIMPQEVRQQDPLLVWAEAYNQIIADKEGFLGEPPDVPGLVPKKNFKAYVDRKLFIHNLGHATGAYLGHLAGATTIPEAMDLPGVAECARAAMWESANSLMQRYPGEFSQPSQHEHIEDLLHRFTNRALSDSVYRVGRDLYRKLGQEDRFMGALRLDLEQGIEPLATVNGIVAALRFRGTDELGNMFEDDVKFVEQIELHGVQAILQEVAGFDMNVPKEKYWLDVIVQKYHSK